MKFAIQGPRAVPRLSIHQDWAYLGGGVDDNGNDMTTFEKINLITGESVSLSPLTHATAASYFFAIRN